MIETLFAFLVVVVVICFLAGLFDVLERWTR
jgi:hypothetical protein